LLIAVTDTLGSEDKFRNYLKWLLESGVDAGYRIFSPQGGNPDDLKACSGLLLTGGHDVDPALYNGPAAHPKIKPVNRERDDFELKLLDYAVKNRMPVLGICRGLQLANVYFGGTLFPDCEEAGFRAHKPQSGQDCVHPVSIEKGTLLHKICGADTAVVNSSHHQAADKHGRGLKVSARSEDGVIEAMELEDNSENFFLLVQWHPERMAENSGPPASGILKQFIKSIKTHHKHLLKK